MECRNLNKERRRATELEGNGKRGITKNRDDEEVRGSAFGLSSQPVSRPKYQQACVSLCVCFVFVCEAVGRTWHRGGGGGGEFPCWGQKPTAQL